jgi:hypothetical protein
MSRRAALALLGSVVCACAAPSPRWVPDLVVSARLGQRARAAGEGFHWQAGAALRWRLDGASALETPGSEPTATAASATPTCTQPALCAWERQQRERAIEAALREAELPAGPREDEP